MSTQTVLIEIEQLNIFGKYMGSYKEIFTNLVESAPVLKCLSSYSGLLILNSLIMSLGLFNCFGFYSYRNAIS